MTPCAAAITRSLTLLSTPRYFTRARVGSVLSARNLGRLPYCNVLHEGYIRNIPAQRLRCCLSFWPVNVCPSSPMGLTKRSLGGGTISDMCGGGGGAERGRGRGGPSQNSVTQKRRLSKENAPQKPPPNPRSVRRGGREGRG